MAQAPETFDRSPEDSGPHRSAPVDGVSVADAGHRPVVHVAGRVDRAVVVEVSGTIRGLLASGVRELAVDLSACWEADGLLPVLSRAHTELTDRGATLRVVGVSSPALLAALAAAPLGEVLAIYYTARHTSRHRRESAGRSVQRRTDWPTPEGVALRAVPGAPGPSTPTGAGAGPSPTAPTA